MDYLFAAVMLANPLFWMEVQFLSANRRNELREIMAVWKEHRAALARADVAPIGEKPTGSSFTGFYVSCDDESEYMLLFREATQSAKTMIASPVKEADVQLLASNTDACVEIKDGFIHAEFKKPRSYAFIKLQR